ncbi:hypothetical protein H5V45_01820 [Nocardioides sp. KIGAM211]|uniref:Lipoprotein n=1 Tax=Nocardioides luti TaxID=2761101 RepID=A0A7X0RD07_9ACTN|nr:hypothetical protein [Nocardioides luti]MBB6626047.1 hypothetical protein [Nocardioides luti]
MDGRPVVRCGVAALAASAVLLGLSGCSTTTCSDLMPEASHLLIRLDPSVPSEVVTLRARLCVEDRCSTATLVSRVGGKRVLDAGVSRDGGDLHVVAGAFGDEPFRAGATYDLRVTAWAAHHRQLARQEDSFELDETEPNGEGCDPTVLLHELTVGV